MKSIVVGGLSKRGPVSLARSLVATFALLLSASVYAAGVTIDDFVDRFTEGLTDGLVTAGGVSSTGATISKTVCGQARASSATIIGGERDVSINVLRGDRSVVLEVNSNVLSINNESQTAGNVTIQWDGRDDDASVTSECELNHRGLGGQNLTAAGGNQLQLMVIESDAATDIVFRVYTSSSQWSQYTLELTRAIRTMTTFTIGFSSAEWEHHGGGVEWDAVGAIEMEIVDPPNSLDIVFDYLVTPVTYDLTANSVTEVDGGVEICWETEKENNLAGYFVGRCGDDSCSEGKDYIFLEGVSALDGLCQTLDIELEDGYMYGVVAMDNDGTMPEQNWNIMK